MTKTIGEVCDELSQRLSELEGVTDQLLERYRTAVFALESIAKHKVYLISPAEYARTVLNELNEKQ